MAQQLGHQPFNIGRALTFLDRLDAAEGRDDQRHDFKPEKTPMPMRQKAPAEDPFQQKANDLFRRSLEAAAHKRRHGSDPPSTPKTSTPHPHSHHRARRMSAPPSPLSMPMSGDAPDIASVLPGAVRRPSMPINPAMALYAEAPPPPLSLAQTRDDDEEVARSPMRRRLDTLAAGVSNLTRQVSRGTGAMRTSFSSLVPGPLSPGRSGRAAGGFFSPPQLPSRRAEDLTRELFPAEGGVHMPHAKPRAPPPPPQPPPRQYMTQQHAPPPVPTGGAVGATGATRAVRRKAAKAAKAAKAPPKRGTTARTQRPSAASTDPQRDCHQHGYAPLGPIAAGAFSTIHRASVMPGHARLPAGLHVAIKTWSNAQCAKSFDQRLTRDSEIATLRAAARVPHPHVANIVAVLAGPVFTHAVLEYCAGGSLLRHMQHLSTLKSKAPGKVKMPIAGQPAQAGGGAHAGGETPQGAMPEAHALRISRQVASALAWLHANHICHRDVKPANVLFVDSAREDVKLCDFGFAVFCADAGEPRRLRVKCGTPIYSAPELVAGREYLGPPVDMWAFGALVYELLHGKPAFHGATLPQVEQRIRQGSAHLTYTCAADARALVQGCLADRPHQRLDANSALRTKWLFTPGAGHDGGAAEVASEEQRIGER